MEQFNGLIQLLSSFITLVLLPVLLVRSKHRASVAEADKSEAEADSAEADNITSYAVEWKRLYEQKAEKETELNTKIDALYTEITSLRDRLRDANEQISKLTIDNQSLQFRKCNKRGCPERTPPSEF